MNEAQSKMSEYRLHNRLGYQLTRLSKLVEINLETGLAKHGITRLQWGVLSSVGIENRCKPSDLAKHIGVSRPCMSRTLKKMEASQLIERLPIGGDGRARALKLTDKGHEKLALCWEHAEAVEQKLISKLQPEQVQRLLTMVRLLTRGETIELDSEVRQPELQT